MESSYLKEDRYKRKFMQIFRAIAKLREEDPSLDRRVDKRLRLGDVSRIPAVNVKIEKLINRKQKLKSENSKWCVSRLPPKKNIYHVSIVLNYINK